MAEKRSIKVTCVIVSSLNGKITNGTNPHIYTWTSKEDQKHFFSLIEQATCIIMGRNTYEQAKEMIRHKEGRLRIVLTSNPEQYKNQTIPGQLEFTNESSTSLLAGLENQGIKEVLLVGGSFTNTAFLEEDCIDELWLTIEPLIFAEGTPLFTKPPIKKLKFFSFEKLNEQGTILLKYTLS